MGFYFKIREKLRFNPTVNKGLYLGQSLYRSLFGRLVSDVRRDRNSARTAQGVALCLRFRDEARYLEEWLEYHHAAGVSHFYLYDNFSADNYREVLEPWVQAGLATIVEWPKTPASPSAEEDCIWRALGRFAWIGFLDADEFLVIRDGRSIGEFLDSFPTAPGVGLSWRMFGSSLHRQRPKEPVIVAYQLRAEKTNQHVKSFVRPWRAAQCRNSHSWFYFPLGAAVDEHGRPLYGSLSMNPTSDDAWINHYYAKSEEDYLEKAARKQTQDLTGMRFPSRRVEKLADEMTKNNDVEDASAAAYYRTRCAANGRPAKLLQPEAARNDVG